MARSSVKLFGFEEASRRIKRMGQLETANVSRAMKLNAIKSRDAVKRTIRKGEPGWDPLAASTIAAKGSSKPLIDSGDLLNSVVSAVQSAFVWFVGVLRKEKTIDEDGDTVAMVDIAMAMEYGTSRSNKMGAHVRSGGESASGHIPARPYLAPTFHRVKDACAKRIVAAVKAAKDGKRYVG